MISHANEHKQLHLLVRFLISLTAKQLWFAKFEIGEEFVYEDHHWGANKKIMDIINKRDKSPEALRLVKKRQENIKHGNLCTLLIAT